MKYAFIRVAAVMAIVAGTPAQAQEAYPTRPITYVVPYTPGGTNDNSARIVARALEQRLGQPVVIENRPGAGGTLGAAKVAHARPDGYTLLNASIGNLAIAPQLLPAQFDPFKDFTPLAHIGGSRSVIAVNPSLPINSIEELIDYAKKNPGKLTYGTSGNGTPGNISMEYFKMLSGVDILHIPYKGSAPSLADAVAGHIDLVSDPLANGFVKAGKLRGLAYFGADSAPDLPGVPSITASYPQWNFSGSFIAVAPAGTPQPVVEKLRRAFSEALSDAKTQAELTGIGVSPEIKTPEQTSELIKATYSISKDIIQRANISVNE
ncbi:Bug family tripartite tricarboxylate transporter substrate binding protein [Brenneria tiliae]|uniref:Tripartite tricarboxylate transporter substrate binding protein n=1 Tax=Brenneria tiliae TaxID=2914984 RepID=A0ABT0MWF9_9GAMM|nr:tripartite tricarboxylate transporter substrate binding protein [Brenneria tiliae]MCL2894176.1 tripartite tricarboxylate transporter substrate binding protein [Brenneria tiliae]MCL2898837.1 tripartite tricarboxylate transporter substrate binding protein [Brenneria tiliae]MCL2903226.1 tripartite tricarboxylate transporter substrate binding protein [Brenneria tiliae]